MTPTEPSALQSNAETVRRLFNGLNAHDTCELQAVWNADTVEHFPDKSCHGRDQITAYFQDKFTAIEGYHMQILALAASGDDVFVHWRMTGRHVGSLVGVEGTGRSIELAGMDHFILRDGVVVENTVVFDQMAFARQIGLLPPDNSSLDKALKAAFNAGNRIAGAARRSLRR